MMNENRTKSITTHGLKVWARTQEEQDGNTVRLQNEICLRYGTDEDGTNRSWLCIGGVCMELSREDVYDLRVACGWILDVLS